MRQAGATLHRGAQASHYRGLSRCGAQAPDTQAQQLWLTGLAAPRHVGSSQTRARTRVPCIGRQILNHCATREAQNKFLKDQNKTEQKNKDSGPTLDPSDPLVGDGAGVVREWGLGVVVGRDQEQEFQKVPQVT